MIHLGFENSNKDITDIERPDITVCHHISIIKLYSASLILVQSYPFNCTLKTLEAAKKANCLEKMNSNHILKLTPLENAFFYRLRMLPLKSQPQVHRSTGRGFQDLQSLGPQVGIQTSCRHH